MFDEVLNACITAIIDGLEDFFNVVTYPSRKYIKTAIFVACGFLATSILGLLFKAFIFVNWYESLAAIILLLIIYFVSDISSKQVQDTANLMMLKTTRAINKAKKSMTKNKKKPTRKPNKRDR